MANNTKQTTAKGLELRDLPTCWYPNFIGSPQKPIHYFFAIQLKDLSLRILGYGGFLRALIIYFWSKSKILAIKFENRFYIYPFSNFSKNTWFLSKLFSPKSVKKLRRIFMNCLGRQKKVTAETRCMHGLDNELKEHRTLFDY